MYCLSVCADSRVALQEKKEPRTNRRRRKTENRGHTCRALTQLTQLCPARQLTCGPNYSLFLSKMSIRNLQRDGFVVWRRTINIEETFHEMAKCFVRSEGIDIFNHNEDKPFTNDRKRRQRDVMCKEDFCDVIGPLEALIEMRFPNHLSPQWVVLDSLPGCQRQAAHADYLPSVEFDNCPDDMKPLAIIVAIQNNTYFDVWPKSINMANQGVNKQVTSSPIRRETLHLDRGDVLIFRGDLIHCGSSYPNRKSDPDYDGNVRLHAYLDSPLVPRSPDQTWLIHRDAPDEVKEWILT